MITPTDILAENAEVLQLKFAANSNSYDDLVFLDLSLNTSEFRVVDKRNGEYMLYIRYPKLGFFGSFSNYKFLIYFYYDGETPNSKGKIRLKSFSILFLIAWYSVFAFMLAIDITYKDFSAIVAMASSAIFIFAWIFLEYFYFRKKVRCFLNLLLTEPYPFPDGAGEPKK